MDKTAKRQENLSHLSDSTRWTSLRYFSGFRVVVAALICVNAYLPSFGLSVVEPYPLLYRKISAAYLIAVFLLAFVLPYSRLSFSWQLTIQVLLDILALSSLIFVGEGIKSGLPTLMLVSLAGAGLVGHGRLVLFYAACATIVLLCEETLQFLKINGTSTTDYLHTAYLCLGFFVTAIVSRLIGHRVLENEALALQRGIDLNDQIIVSQRAIEEMQDGVLVVTKDGEIRQYNPTAARFIAIRNYNPTARLAEYSPELVSGYLKWIAGEGPNVIDFKVNANNMNLQARFAQTASSKHDFLVFLEDMDRLQEAAQQIKLAALGRLSGSIAHEIRNPLSSISHATELLSEERRVETQDRLLRIMRDNVARIGRIVTDVLQLGRRDRIFPEMIPLASFLEQFRDDFALKESVLPDLIEIHCPISIRISFDRVHLDQILWNLVRNAMRHGQGKPGSIEINVQVDLSRSRVEIHITDDGPGINPENQKQIFEPFFTTHTKGTGLGLYLARELCTSNNAEIDLIPGTPTAPGAHFRIVVRDHYVANPQ